MTGDLNLFSSTCTIVVYFSPASTCITFLPEVQTSDVFNEYCPLSKEQRGSCEQQIENPCSTV